MKILFGIAFILCCISCSSNKYPSKKVYEISFNRIDQDSSICDFIFPDPETDSSLIILREKYQLKDLVESANSDIEKALVLLNWTNSRWKHNGSNKPKHHDALSILEEVDQGKNFRCVEYGIVLSASLNSMAISTRTLGLKTKDVETAQVGAGHVVSEAYIPDLKKWVFLDPQKNYIPFVEEKPLNAVEYQDAIKHRRKDIELRNIHGVLSDKRKENETEWVGKYLFYFNGSFDYSGSKMKCKGKRQIMLVPLGEKGPTVFQIDDGEIDYCIYTHNLKDFYKEPIVRIRK